MKPTFLTDYSGLIPILDWNEFLIDPIAFSKKLVEPFTKFGFVIVDNHPMNEIIVKKGEQSFKDFFNLPLESKLLHEFKEIKHQTGYTPLRVEKGVTATNPDEKEFYHVFAGHTPAVLELPNFIADVEALWWEFFRFLSQFMEAVAISIDEPRNFFAQTDDDRGFSLVRGLNYPAMANPYQGGKQTTEGGNATGMCAWEHSDIDLMTGLLAKEPGLQLEHEEGWIPVTITKPTQIIMNVGDMLQHITNGKYVSGIHRVVCEDNTQRSSIPFFFHPLDAFSIVPRPQFGPAQPQFKYTTAGEYLHVRLKEIGL